jgi:Carboxypeptidase regulatory-like domain/TonB-dependent Receptor Plug Domain
MPDSKIYRGGRMKFRTLQRNATENYFTFLRGFICLLIVAVALPFAAHAQQYSGTVNGTVTDPGGAAVAGATVTYTNLGTNSSDTATTSESGVFIFAQLPIGVYDIRVKQPGFKEFVSKNVEVHTSTVTEVNVQLTVGAVTETMTVEASDVQVQTTSAAVGEVVSGTQVRELPLNGENFMGLVTLSPGVSTANSFNDRDKGLTGGADFSVNGNPYNYNLFLIDGVNNNDVGSGRTILVYPSVDAIAEFKMIRNSYGPEYGQAAGAIISITTRSGENQFHGGFFYAGRNDALDANDWFSNFNGTGKAELRRNDWGYHVAGPILKDKLFFFWNQEWNREVRGQSVAACVPTAAEQAGDFSKDFAGAAAPTLKTPSGTLATDQCNATQPAQWVGPVGAATYQSLIPVGKQVVGNAFAIANPDPAGSLIEQFYPLPNSALRNGNNWSSSENLVPKWSEWNIRADYDVTNKNRITFRYTNDSWTSPGPDNTSFWGVSQFPTINSDWSQPSKSVMAKLTTQVSNTLINDVEFGYGHNAIITTLSGTASGVVGDINAAVPTAWPASLKQTNTFGNAGAVWGGLSPYGSGQTMWNIAPYANHEDLYALQDNVSKVHGNHLFKVGVYYSTNAKIEDSSGGTDQPAFNYNNGGLNSCPPSNPGCTTNMGQPLGVPLGNQLANLLLPGQEFVTSEKNVNATAMVNWHDFEWYVGDSWKIRRNVTINYGFRWSYFREPYAGNNHWANFSLADWSPTEAAANPSDACNGVIIVPSTSPCADAAAQLAALGVTLPLSNGTPGNNRALVNNNNHAIAPRLGVAWDVFGNGKLAVRAGGGQFFQREPVGLLEQLAFTAPFAITATDVRTLGVATPLANPQVSPSGAENPRNVIPNSWQWNVSIEKAVGSNSAFQVGYVGNSGIHLTSGIDMNAVPNTDWTQTAFLGGGDLNAFRPASNFGTIAQFGHNGKANYQSLQMLFRSRLSNFSTFQVAYTYSHSIGDVQLDNSSGSVNNQATTDQADPGLDKGNTNINRPHIFVANEVFYLPKLANHSELIRQTIGGWELNSIINIESGSSVSVFSNGAGGATVNGVSSSLNALQGSGFSLNNRPDVVLGTSCNSGENGRQILNPAAFTLVGYTIGTVGDAPRGYCFGPNNRNVDMQLAKNWLFKERFRVKFALDFFNLFNHANFIGSNLESANFNASGLVCGASQSACTPTNNVISGQQGNPNAESSGFGQANNVHPGREIQYSLKFTF